MNGSEREEYGDPKGRVCPGCGADLGRESHRVTCENAPDPDEYAAWADEVEQMTPEEFEALARTFEGWEDASDD